MVSLQSRRDLFGISAGGMAPHNIVGDHRLGARPFLGCHGVVECRLIEYAATSLQIGCVMTAA